jgi:hypothetical protein
MQLIFVLLHIIIIQVKLKTQIKFQPLKINFDYQKINFKHRKIFFHLYQPGKPGFDKNNSFLPKMA